MSATRREVRTLAFGRDCFFGRVTFFRRTDVFLLFFLAASLVRREPDFLAAGRFLAAGFFFRADFFLRLAILLAMRLSLPLAGDRVSSSDALSMPRISRTDLDVFPLCLGGNVFGWTADEPQSFAVLDRYVAAGGNFIDTADVYSAWVPGHAGGESETIIGRWMAARLCS